MNELREFLHGTGGRHLYDFWLDCEFYGDSVDDANDDHSRQLRTRLFRCVGLLCRCAFVNWVRTNSLPTILFNAINDPGVKVSK